MSPLADIPRLGKRAQATEQRALPDTPAEKVYFREYDYSQPYFVEGTPGLFGEALPLRMVRFKGGDPEGVVSLLSPVKDPESVHVPGVDDAG